jgi:glycosyltransferase involved in cell wall biosynthesis
VAESVDTYRTWGFRKRADQCTPFEMAGYLFSSAIPTLQHLAKFKPDLIHAHFAVPTGMLALACTRLFGRPYLITAHLGDVPGAIPEQTDNLFRWLNPVIRPIWQKAAQTVAVSKFVGDLAQKAYGCKPAIIPNGISLAGRPPVPQPANRTPRMIFVGRLNSQKNLLYLPSILAKIRTLKWELDLVGDGAERHALETAFDEFNLSGRVHFHGWLDRQVVETKLKEADIFILPSLVEGLSVAVLEALKFGLVLVGSDLPTLHDCVSQNVNGYLIPLESPNLWIMRLTTILTEPNLRHSMRQKSWEMAPKFDLNHIADQYEALYAKIVEKAKGERQKEK